MHSPVLGVFDNDNPDQEGLFSINPGQGLFTNPLSAVTPTSLVSTMAAAPKTVAAAVPQQVLYLLEPGTGTSISASDINQAGLGDCFMLSAIGEMAINSPSSISSMIRSDGHGGELVSLYQGANHQPISLSTTSFSPVTVDVSNSFSTIAVNSWTTNDTYKGQTEIWPEVIEKAYAQLNGGYGAIANGGYDMVAMETLTGHAAQYTPIGRASLATLETQKAGTIMEFDTPNSSSLGYNLVGDHAYMFDGFQATKTDTMVKLLNPWGNHEPALIPWSQVSHQIAGITIGHIV